MSLLRLGYKKTMASVLLSLACSKKEHCRVVSCPRERHRWQETEGGLWLTLREELRPLVQ